MNTSVCGFLPNKIMFRRDFPYEATSQFKQLFHWHYEINENSTISCSMFISPFLFSLYNYSNLGGEGGCIIGILLQ